MSTMGEALTPEARAARAAQLAHAVREQALLEEDHADRRKAMAIEKAEIQRRIRDLAEVVRAGVEDRPAQLLLLGGARPDRQG